MNLDTLQETARALVAPGKGILATDESTGTAGKRLASIGVENTEENRRAYRELLFTAPEVEQYVSGVILYDETLRQAAADGTPFPKLLADRGIIPGIKVDVGTKDLAFAPGEKITEGLDGLRDRLMEYRDLGARFAKWRAVIVIDAQNGLPSEYCIHVNAHALARYAALCQEQDIVPIVEPEVLMDGAHDSDACFDVTKRTLNAVFEELRAQRVELSGILLKPNMVIAGEEHGKDGPAHVAEKTVACFRDTVPAEVPGIVFLSGGQTEPEACENLNAMNQLPDHGPWELSFSYGRALQQSALHAWGGKPQNVPAAQAAFAHRAKLASAARAGSYSVEMEKELTHETH